MTTETQHTHADALTVVETALLLHVSTRTVWRYLARGRLTALRHPMNRRVYVCEQEARAAAHAAREKVTSPRPERHAE